MRFQPISMRAKLVAAALFAVALWSTVPAYAAPVAARSSASIGRVNAAAGPFTIAKPAGTVTGDFMVASIGYRPCSSTSGGGCTTTITPPAGWTLVRFVEQTEGGGTGGNGLRFGIYSKVVTALEASVLSYTWTIAGAPLHNGAAGVITSFINVDTSDPIVNELGVLTPVGRNHSSPNLGVIATNTMLVTTHAVLSAVTWTPPAGMTEILDFQSERPPSAVGISLEVNIEQRPNPGATGLRTASFTGASTLNDRGAAHALALRPIQSDPTIAMTRSGTLTVGTPASYALTVGNGGPANVNATNVTVTNTLPAGLTFTSFAGAGWSCTVAAQVVTCTRAAASLPVTLTKGSTFPVLTINVNVVSGTVWTNTATVSAGVDGDNNTNNSTATNTGPTVTTTLATGTDPAVNTIGPSGASTIVNAFTFKTNSAAATEPVSEVTVNLSANLGFDTLSITDSTGGTIYGSIANPVAGPVTITMSTPLTATFTTTTLNVRVTPLVHVVMPAPPGGTYTVTAPVTGWTGPAAHTGSDTNNNALTIDNQSPNSATLTSGVGGLQNTTLNWRTSNSGDFNSTNGSVIYRWSGGVAGAEVPNEGSTPVVGQTNGSAAVACVRSSAASTAVSAVDGSGGSGGCSTFALVTGQVYTYKVFQKDNFGNYDAGVVIGSFGTLTPGSFNVFETSTAAGSISGVIKTKISGAAYSLDLVAIRTGAVLASFSGDVSVDLIANASTGVLLDANGCPSSGTTLAVGTATIAGGRSTINFPAVAEAWRDVRVRIRYPTSSPTTTTCSNDNFAIRPQSFSVAASDTDWLTAGVTRTLANTATSGGNLHKAGRPFTIRGTANNAVAAATTNYVGIPTISIASYLTPATCTTCTLTTGSVATTSGVFTSSTASYNEVGTFVLQAVDTTFASVDEMDSSTAERYINGTGNVGRFVPDSLDVAVGQNGKLQPACGANFTYTGQPMTYMASPVVNPKPTLTIRAMAYSVGGDTVTQNYTGTLQKLVAGGIAITAPMADTTTNGLDGATKSALVAAMTAGTLSNSAGTMTYTLPATDTFTYTRNANSLIAPFNSDIRLVVTAVSEPASADGVASAGVLPTLRPTATSVRFGRLRMQNAYGSELLQLAIPIRAETWQGTHFLTEANDSCTALAVPAVAAAPPTGAANRYFYPVSGKNQLAAANTVVTLATPAMVGGVNSLNFTAPGATRSGWLDVILDAPTHLMFDWGNCMGQAGAVGAWDDRPCARATFGLQSKETPIIYRRESY